MAQNITYYPGDWAHKDGRVADVGYEGYSTIVTITHTTGKQKTISIAPSNTRSSYDIAREILEDAGFKHRMF